MILNLYICYTIGFQWLFQAASTLFNLYLIYRSNCKLFVGVQIKVIVFVVVVVVVVVKNTK